MFSLIEKIRKILPINIIRQRSKRPSIGQEETQVTQETQDVSFVLDCFRHMGASQDQLAAEKNKLIADNVYCKNWCKTTGFLRGSK